MSEVSVTFNEARPPHNLFLIFEAHCCTAHVQTGKIIITDVWDKTMQTKQCRIFKFSTFKFSTFRKKMKVSKNFSIFQMRLF